MTATKTTTDPDDQGASSKAPSRKFRIEHRIEGNTGVVLAHVRDVFPHHDTLTPYISRLLREHDSPVVLGELVLIDEETEQVLARRALSRGLVPRRTLLPQPRPRRAS